MPSRPLEPATRTLDDLCPSRRSVLRGLATMGGVVLVPGVLVACGASDDSGDTDDADGTGTGGEDGGGSAAVSGSVPAADVAVGTAVVVQVGEESVVVGQPTEGEFVAFSARCTHQGTTVESSDSLVVTCPLHGSEFDLADAAAPVQGPATTPLTEVSVTLEGDQLVFA